jgi:hypothetical protein
MILGSEEICRVCKTLGIDPEDVTDYHRYPIADNDSPCLSADRLEYTLGNIVNFGIGTRQTVKAYYENLVATDTELVFRDEHIACAFAKDALKCSRVYVADADRYSMQRLANLLARAIHQGVLGLDELYLQEADVLRKLENSSFLEDWQRFRAISKVVRTDRGGLVIPAKKRYIDPLTLEGKRASQLDDAFQKDLADFLAWDFGYGVAEG